MVAILGFSKDQIAAAVQAMYGDVAKDPGQYFHFPIGRPAALAVGYPKSLLDQVPEAAVDRFVGVGYPFRADAIEPGDTVLDIGSGAGTDTLLASRKVGSGGKVFALDLTPEMVAQLKKTLREAGIKNVEPIEANAEEIPLPEQSVDVVTSNGVLNLVLDKRKACAEIFRVLRPTGWVQIADIVIAKPVPVGGRSDPKLWAECVVGASIDEDYLNLFREAGFEDIEVLRSFDYFAESPSADTRRIAAGLGARTIELRMRRGVEEKAPVPWWNRFARRLHPRRLRLIGERGLWGAVSACVSLVACYGTLGLLGILSLFGIGMALPEAAWAGFIVAAALIAVIATGFNLRLHRQPAPLFLTGLGAGMLAYAMFVNYSFAVEITGFVVLFTGIVFDLYKIYETQCLPKASG
ncbi:MerC family mercury resistance protein [Chelativorans sp. YIM 93263]|uniref:MerC family mercury resistance protein n=1 Tax=Chelativorans sp. YIM 93263 TaxID=2906648 RepID=UPI002378E691|nr:MerC family mercury resistance protein [Chelativorans sp. YIM 93263]